MPRFHVAILSLSVLLNACANDGSHGSVSCGLAAMNGPLVALEGFARGRALAGAPGVLPDSVPGRYVAGPAGSVVLTRDSANQLHARIDVSPPERTAPGFGVLIMANAAEPMGIMIHDGAPIPGATVIGTILVADSSRPLYGVRVRRDEVETSGCPLFPAAGARTP